MFKDIFLPILVVIGAFLYLKWLYRVNNGFFRKNVNLFSNSKDLQGWAGGLLILIVGLCYLIKGILKLWVVYQSW